MKKPLTAGILAWIIACAWAPAWAQFTTSGMTNWWNPAWHERFRVTFDHLQAETGAEVAVIRLRPGFELRRDPYDIRVVDDTGTSLPVRVIDWTPRGELTCLVGIATATLARGNVPDIDLYFGNPSAPPTAFDYDWHNPMVLLGPRLKRSYRRHGEWQWEANPVFGSVHIGINTDVPPTRAGHSVTSLETLSCHPRRMRTVQMVWLDPASPPEAIALDFLFDKQILSAYWTNSANTPADPMPDTKPRRIGPLPPTGKWVRIEVTTDQLGLEKRNNLRGIGFSNHGGLVKWGPTALGAMPVEGRVIAREILTADAGTTRPMAAEIFPVDRMPPMEARNVRFDLVEAPLFVEENKPLTLTFFASPSFRFTGEMQDCPVIVAAIRRDAAGVESERTIRQTMAAFPGGDNWQQALELTPAEWRDAIRIEGRLVIDGTSTPTAVLRLEAPGAVEGLYANGTLLRVGQAVVTFVLSARRSARSISPLAGDVRRGSATLVLTDSIECAADPLLVSVNSSDPRIGLPPQTLLYARRSPAEWVVAASHVMGSSEFGSVRFTPTSHLPDIGLPLPHVSLYLKGMVRMLQHAPGLQITINLGNLRESADTERGRALLGACMASQSLLKNNETTAAPRGATAE